MSELLVDKYKPKGLDQIIGHQATIKSLTNFLNRFIPEPNSSSDQTKKSRHSSSSSLSKAVLLSGPPGIGKTTLAILVPKSLGFNVIEFNASDIRSKTSLSENVAPVISNRPVFPSLTKFIKIKSSSKSSISETKTSKLKKYSEPTPKYGNVIVMDEVDGMSAGDRGGVAELIQMIKKTSVPMILLCNDKNSPKIKSLLTYVNEIPIRRPTYTQVSSFCSKVALRENINCSKEEIEKMVISSGNDIRSSLNTLFIWKTLGKSENISTEKDKTRNVFESSAALFRMPISDVNTRETEPNQIGKNNEPLKTNKIFDLNASKKMAFSDPELTPLFIFENYLNIKTTRNYTEENIDRLITNVDSFCRYNVLENVKSRTQEYSYYPLITTLGAILPAGNSGENWGGEMLRFPTFWTVGSSVRKNKGLLSTCLEHSGINRKNSFKIKGLDDKIYLSGGLDSMDFRLYEGEYIERIVMKLLNKGEIEIAAKYLNEKGLLKDDFLFLNGLRNEKDFEKIEAKNKLKLTKECKLGRSWKRFGTTEKLSKKGKSKENDIIDDSLE